MIKYVNFLFKEVNPLLHGESRVSLHDVPQRDDCGWGDLYQQLKVEFDEDYKIISVEVIGTVVD